MKEKREDPPPPARIAIATLGCKVNQFESGTLRGAMESLGNLVEVPFGQPAEVCIINTCSVTGKADAESRRLIRQARRINPDARIIVTGCYATRAPEEAGSISPGIAVLPNARKGDIPGILSAETVTSGNGRQDPAVRHANRKPGFASGRARAYLKIQDGCDGVCTYCVVPSARGRSRSIDPGQVLESACAAAERGFREIVLTGIHIGNYGKDLRSNVLLDVLIYNILSSIDNIVIRVSSLEVGELTAGLVDLIVHHPRVCRHLHLPLQSGSDRVLKAMGRRYTSREYLDTVERVKTLNPGVCIGADVILGFPGEEAADFESTCAVLHSGGIDYAHAFSYSRRTGTAAAELENQVPGPLKRERTKTIREISAEKSKKFAASLVGEAASGIVESQIGPGCWRILSDNYQKVATEDATLCVRERVRVRFQGDGRASILR